MRVITGSARGRRLRTLEGILGVIYYEKEGERT